MSKYPIFRHYLEDEDDKPYYTMNSLSFYYEDMERKQKLIESLAKSIAGYDIRLTDNLEAIEKEVDRRLADWDKQLERFPDSVEGLLTKWSTDGTIDTVIQTALIDEKIAPVTAQLAETTDQLNSTEVNPLYPPIPFISAKGDGVTDDTLALRNLLNALGVKGGVLKLPPKSFRITSKLVIPSGVSVIGSGMTESYAGNTANRPTVILKDGSFDAIDMNTSAIMSDLCIDGVTGNTGNGVRLFGNRNRLENVIVSGMGGDGVLIGHSTTPGNRNSWIMRNVASMKNGGRGFVISDRSDGVGPNANAGLAERCNAWSNTGDGWLIGYCSVNTFLQCYSESNGGIGFKISANSLRNVFMSCGAEQNIGEQFLFETGSANNLMITASEYVPVDNGANTIIRSTGGANQVLNISRVLKLGKNNNMSLNNDAGIQVLGNLPGILLHDIDSPETKKTMDILYNNGTLSIRALEDNGTAPNALMTMERVGKVGSLTKFNSMLTANSIGVANTVVATTPGTVVRKMQVFDAGGNSLGFVPIYNAIT